MSKKLYLLISFVFVVVLGLVGSAAAADKTWTGTDSNDWFNAANWDPAAVPVGGYDPCSGDIVHINGKYDGNSVTNFPVINTSIPCAWCRKLWLGSEPGTGEAYLTIQDGGELTVRSYDPNALNQTIVLGQKIGTQGIINMSGGTINMASHNIEVDQRNGEEMEVGGRGNQGGDGTFNMTGGRFNNGKICLTGYEGTGTGVLNLDGGVIDCNGYSMLASRDGTLNVYSGSFITDVLLAAGGHHINLYGGVIDSNDYKIHEGFDLMDIYDGVWYNRSQKIGAEQGRRSSWDVRWYAHLSSENPNPPSVVAYGGRGTVVIESFPYVPDLPEDQWEGFQVYADFDTNIAYWPNPENGFEAADMEQTLSWYPGYSGNAAFHDVYFGTDFNDVNNATLEDPCGVYITRMPADQNYIARVDYWPQGPLQMGQTYYWRIDEVNEANSHSPWRGPVWNFGTNYVGIDDFESYGSDTELRASWKDNADPENSTSCQAFSKDDQALDSRSMYLNCMNLFSPYYSEVWRNFAQPQDWSPTATDARLLALSYYGKTDNTDAGIYVKLTDSLGAEATQWISKDPATCRVTSWTERLLALKDFGGVDLAKISRITIGVSTDPVVITSIVKIWVDNVRLYLAGCYPSYRSSPVDFNCDCIIDLHDLKIMEADGGWWLLSEWDVEVIEPVGVPVLWYKFDGDATDSSDNGYDGTITDADGIEWANSHLGEANGALVFDGNETRVDIPVAVLDDKISRQITASFWMYGYEMGGIIFNGMRAGSQWADRALMFAFSTGPYASIGNDGNSVDDVHRYSYYTYHKNSLTAEPVGQWNLWAITKDCDANEMKIYVNGELVTRQGLHGNISNPNIPIQGVIKFVMGVSYTGLLDDFRIYDYAMGQGELLSLAGRPVGSTFTQPLQQLLGRYNLDLVPDGMINFADYALLTDLWLEEFLFGE